jgi:hypothetical protein
VSSWLLFCTGLAHLINAAVDDRLSVNLVAFEPTSRSRSSALDGNRRHQTTRALHRTKTPPP